MSFHSATPYSATPQSPQNRHQKKYIPYLNPKNNSTPENAIENTMTIHARLTNTLQVRNHTREMCFISGQKMLATWMSEEMIFEDDRTFNLVKLLVSGVGLKVAHALYKFS
ncbi:MAG: hypothetical protein GY938_23985 [Ketobacter sp.]|nr:hypothetical protein [Ketobacter sp.]